MTAMSGSWYVGFSSLSFLMVEFLAASVDGAQPGDRQI